MNTGRDILRYSKPNILWVIAFGWIFLLVRGAFAIRTDRCRDCGAVSRYKSGGSWVALTVLIVLVVLIVIAIVGDQSQ